MSASSSTRSWWSRSGQSPSTPSSSLPGKSPTTDKPHSISKKRNIFASAIGLKPKRPSIAIQDPPSPVLPLHTDIGDPPPLPNSPQSGPGYSNGQHWDDMLEPLTPFDSKPSYARSVMTISDDPFAAREIVVPPSIRDPTRLSVLSDTDVPDHDIRGKGDALSAHRISFASSSSQSQQSDSHARPSSSSLLPVQPGWRASRMTVQSDKSPRREPAFLAESPTSPTGTLHHGWGGSKSNLPSSLSSTTLTDKGHIYVSPIPPVPRRPRGLTVNDAGPSRRGMSSTSETSLSPSSCAPTTDSNPRVVVRQASLTKMQAPPPPTVPLPPRPSPSRSHHHGHDDPYSPSGSISAPQSIKSFRPPSRPPINPRYPSHGRDSSAGSSVIGGRDSINSSASSIFRTELSPPKSLKKAISQQTLSKRPSVLSIASSSSTTVEDVKFIKKQRSFHSASRAPVPAVPTQLRHNHSYGAVSVSSPPSDEPFPGDYHRDSMQSSQSQSQSHAPPTPGSGRRRLFSGSSIRRSTSSHAHSTTDDDMQSVFSLPNEPDSLPNRYTNPFGTADSGSSMWDDGPGSSSAGNGHGGGGGGGGANDYVPQRIMSPADMLRLEALVQEGKSDVGFVRSRGTSFTSISTSMSNAFSEQSSHESGMPSTPPTSSHHPHSSAGLSHNRLQQPGLNSDGSPRHRAISKVLGVNVPSSHGRPRTAQEYSVSSQESFLPEPSTASFGLPPPPRPRRPMTADRTEQRTSIMPMLPLSPPPARKASRSLRALDKEQIVARRSMMKKPSFLEIADEGEKMEFPPADDSFLDMGKASLDISRSSEEGEEVGVGPHRF